MAKKRCNICGKEIGFLDKNKILDGYVCFDCLDKSGLRKCMGLANLSFTTEQIKKTLTGELKAEKPIKYSIGNNVIYINRPANTWMTKIGMYVPGHRMENIISYDYIENDKKYSVTKTVGAAAVGGLLFGGAGALVGALIGNNQKRIIKTAAIYVTEKSGKGFVTHKIPLVTHDDLPIKEGTRQFSELMSIIKNVGYFFDKAIEENQKRETLIIEKPQNENTDNEPKTELKLESTYNKNQDNPAIKEQTAEITKEPIKEKDQKVSITYKKWQLFIMWSISIVFVALGLVALFAVLFPWAIGWLCASFVMCPKVLTNWSFKKRLLLAIVLIIV